MSLKIKGRVTNTHPDGIVRQNGSVIVEKNDGTLEGSVTYESDRAYYGNMPKIKSDHPYDSRLKLYQIEFTFLGLDKVRGVASYFGLTSKVTDGIIAYSPNTNQDPITSHPDFTTVLAGTPGAPLNGALWVYQSDGAEVGEEYIALDPGSVPTTEFLGFSNPANELFATDFYLTEETLVSRTYWTTDIPKPKGKQIVSEIKGFIKPKDVKNFLLFSPPYRQIGDFYQVTEQYIGSGPKGWNTKVYPTTTA